MRNFLYTGLLLATMVAGCIFESPVERISGDGGYSGISVSNSRSIEIVNIPVDVYIEDTAGLPKTAANPLKKVDDFGYTITCVAHIPPVRVGGDSVQATDIVIHGNSAVIAYNFAGERFAGALQVVDITKSKEPSITQEIIFEHHDINALYTNGSTVVFGGAADPDVVGYRSFVSSTALEAIDPKSIYEHQQQMPSFAVTGIGGTGSLWFASNGALEGTIVTFNDRLMPVDTILMPDARDVAAYQGGICSVSGTTDNDEVQGSVRVFDLDGTLRYIRTIPDFLSDYHKATIEVVRGTYAALGLSEAGCKVLDLQTGTFVVEQANPVIGSGDIKTDCNSVSTDGNLLFTANGNFGFQIYLMKGGSILELERVGFVPFDELKSGNEYYSANHVAFKGTHLFVASGVGGVNIYTCTQQ